MSRGHIECVDMSLGAGMACIWAPVDCDHSKDRDRAFLADSMSTVHGLQVLLRVKVRIVDDDSVSPDEIHTESTGTSREKEDETVAVLSVELIHLGLPFTPMRHAIDTIPHIPLELAVVL